MELAADRVEAAAIDPLFSSSAEDIFVPVCLWTPGYRLMIALRCALSLLVGGVIQMPQLQLLTILYTFSLVS